MKGLHSWLKNSSKMKRWILLILVGIILVSYGIASIIISKKAMSFKHAAKIIVYFTLGFTSVILGLIYLNKRTMELGDGQCGHCRLQTGESFQIVHGELRLVIASSNHRNGYIFLSWPYILPLVLAATE